MILLNNINWSADSRMLDFVEGIKAFRLPRWEQIPTLGLYMDQVVTVIEQALSPVLGFTGEAVITPSMINNYVKLGMVPKPDKKKYSREHITCLLVITILKQASKIGDIRLGIDTALKNGEMGEIYNSFCDYVERWLQIVSSSVVCPDDHVSLNFGYRSDHALFTLAVCSFASYIVTSKMISIIREDERAQEEEHH